MQCISNVTPSSGRTRLCPFPMNGGTGVRSLCAVAPGGYVYDSFYEIYTLVLHFYALVLII